MIICGFSFKLFTENKSLSEVVDYRNGMFTTNNTRFLRFHWEVDLQGRRWKKYYKVPISERWYAPTNLVVDWELDGRRLKEYSLSKHSSYSFNIVNERYFLAPGVVLKATGSMGPCAKLLEAGQICDIESTGIFVDVDETPELLFLHNSRIALYLLYLLNPTPHFYIADLKRIPYKPAPIKIRNIFMKLMKIVVSEKKNTWTTVIETTDFILPKGLESTIKEKYKVQEMRMFKAGIIFSFVEAVAEDLIFSNYSLDEAEISKVYNLTGIPEGRFDNMIGNNEFGNWVLLIKKVYCQADQSSTFPCKREFSAENAKR